MRYRLISSNGCWQASSKLNETPFFINFVKGWHHLKRLEINLQMYANPLSSLRFLGGCISWIARTLSGSRWIPLDVTTNLGIYRWLPSGRIWWDLFLIDVPTCYRILSSDLLRDCLWHNFLLRCCRRSIPLFYVYAHEKLHS